MTIRDEQKERRRQEILYAGLNLFIQKGYSGTTIKDIAGAVGMSAGLLFHYFSSKEDLYRELVELGVKGPMNSLEPIGEEPIKFFERTANQILAMIQSDLFIANMFVLMNRAFYSSDTPANVKQLLSRFDAFTPTAQIIRSGQEQGTIRKGDPLALAITFWSAIQGVAETHAMYPDLPCPESEWITDIIRFH